MQTTHFTDYLKTLYPVDFEYYLAKFEEYHNWLVEENLKINLISRKMDTDDYWTLHYLDSILPVHFIDFYEKRILDFGTGGGLPGIPLSVLHPDSEVILVDSKQKKIKSLNGGIEKLGLDNCSAIAARVEELPRSFDNSFDIIVCRSVRVTPLFKKRMLELLDEGGRIILYKSQNLDDVKLFHDYEIHDVSRDEIGERKIVEIIKLDM